MDNLQLGKEAGKAMDRSEISEETSGTDDNPRIESCSVQEERPCNKTGDLELRNPEKETSASLRPVAVTVSAPAPLQQGPFRVSATDMTCLICFHQFSLARLPKVLACQHAFCAACLKMILRQEDRTWIVRCPLCRKATVVFGGLICSLRNLQHVTAQLGPPGPDAEMAGAPGAAGVWHSQQSPSLEMQFQDSGEINQAAIKRLILLLLLVSLLIVFILPFTNTGLLTWFLCFVVVLGGIICAVLCWDPSWSPPSFSLPLWTKKVNQAA
ncbi:E3 ubiquitin-protein ligase RNF186 [Ahaetulla prasina]|uniref:E3 ubiquitin-protein ligase RNF186 n=1 Tax=Ahaetulla prasina TaxID=499056 RepID=UPI00264A2A0C|nr:E3 ubiquitin-protein ligase RNF186 [Ahaetulla prasina]